MRHTHTSELQAHSFQQSLEMSRAAASSRTGPGATFTLPAPALLERQAVGNSTLRKAPFSSRRIKASKCCPSRAG